MTTSISDPIAASVRPTKAFRLASIATLLIGLVAYCIGLLNADMQLNEKGYYFAVLLFGLFSAVSLQKTVRDKAEGIQTSHIYFILCWVSTCAAVSLLVVGLYSAELLLSEKGFYGIAFLMSLFAGVTVQKNVRDLLLLSNQEPEAEVHHNSDLSIAENSQQG